ncbi:unnamed protein product [Cyprideis torosa]|uniref:Uncharacterized protein n=1 Tax=Cyprideis torosa TaxID=163714 RepID=A0A7R8ZQA5_9CRUS|nr:unnamed protein product [Cyprideis torosa]CAG0895857.1 unnamed protein product [Cyprideis torosa]
MASRRSMWYSLLEDIPTDLFRVASAQSSDHGGSPYLTPVDEDFSSPGVISRDPSSAMASKSPPSYSSPERKSPQDVLEEVLARPGPYPMVVLPPQGGYWVDGCDHDTSFDPHGNPIIPHSMEKPKFETIERDEVARAYRKFFYGRSWTPPNQEEPCLQPALTWPRRRRQVQRDSAFVRQSLWRATTRADIVAKEDSIPAGVVPASLLGCMENPVGESSCMENPVVESSCMENPVGESSCMENPVGESSCMENPV